MCKSNINILSNIYIRKEESLLKYKDKLTADPEFVAQVSGYKALSVLNEKFGGKTSGVTLNDIQRKELKNSISCKYGAEGETTHGKVLNNNGVYSYECRCEPTECKHINECKPKKFDRSYYNSYNKPVADTVSDHMPEFKWLGLSETTSIFNDEPVDNEIIENVTFEDINSEESQYKKIKADDIKTEIIESDINGHILVNAAPGAGKTYTAIQRLIFILNSIDPKDYDSVLVLCYTKAAVNEIKRRIKDGISQKNFSYEAKNVFICTFDSLATNYLISIEIPNDEINKLNYNQRIQRFNKEINPEDYEGFKYCIIDELQDLVNDRAEMTLNILKALKCGYLLLGDKCQAIYDYDCNGAVKINSNEFYRLLGKILPKDVKKYEFLENKRQNDLLSKKSALLRSKLLNSSYDDINYCFKEFLDETPFSKMTAKQYKGEEGYNTIAILCRNNGQAEYLSSCLHKNKVRHTLIRNGEQTISLKRCIADVLWDYEKKTMSIDDFKKRIIARCGFTEEDAVLIYDSLYDIISDDKNNYDCLDCELIAKKLSHIKECSTNLLNEKNDAVTVSTIHKSKGHEFDKVYLLQYDYMPKEGSTEEERILYVAQTRAKEKFEFLKIGRKWEWNFRKSKNNRWIRVTINRKNNREKEECAGFATGLAEDINYSSFVSGDIVEAVNRQKYISENVKIGDKVSLRLSDNDIYQIIHKNKLTGETVIGEMSEAYSYNLKEKFGKKQYVSKKLPTNINNIFITNIITFVSHKDYEGIPLLFKKNRFWLAIEISGFGETKWSES